MQDREDRFDRFSQAIFEIWRSWHKIAGDELEKHGLKGAYVAYLKTLQRHPNGITAVELGRACYKDKADVSRTLSTLESRGLIRRENDGQGVYRARLFLTEEGERIASEINKRAILAVELGGSGLSEDQREMMYLALERISANLRALSEQGVPEHK